MGLTPGPGGRDTTAILSDAADGRVQCLVLLGADPLSDFPDRELARRGLSGAGTVIAVDTFLTASSRQADVVLPASSVAERTGTTTNLEGRVTRLGAKVTSPGVSWPDWMIAVEVASQLGTELGFATIDDITDEIASTVPAFASITRAGLEAPGNADGLVASTGGAAGPGDAPVAAAPQIPPADAYSLRLVSGHALYDEGTWVQHAPALAGLVREQVLRVNSFELDRLGVPSGGRVRVSSARGTLVLEVAADDGVPRGSAFLAFNVASPGAADLIDATAPVTEVRMESL